MIASQQSSLDATDRVWATIKEAQRVTGLTRYHIMAAYLNGEIRAKKVTISRRGTVLVSIPDLLAFVDGLPDWGLDPRVIWERHVLEDDPPPPVDVMKLPRVNHPDWKGPGK